MGCQGGSFLYSEFDRKGVCGVAKTLLWSLNAWIVLLWIEELWEGERGALYLVRNHRLAFQANHQCHCSIVTDERVRVVFWRVSCQLMQYFGKPVVSIFAACRDASSPHWNAVTYMVT